MSYSPHNRLGSARSTQASQGSRGSLRIGLTYVFVVTLLFFVGFYFTTPGQDAAIRGPNNIFTTTSSSSYNNNNNNNNAASAKDAGIRKIEEANIKPASVDPLATKKYFKVIWPAIVPEPSSSYPPTQSMLDVIVNWNPDIPDAPPVFTETLQHFNYSDPAER